MRPSEAISFEFCRDFEHQKTTFPALSCDVACVIRRLVISVEDPLVTDRQTDSKTDRHTTTANTRASYSESRG